ncbi:MAG: NAD(P)-dependent oxidoreductase [bacterium]|nr:NAD(P)-dependent oxidoreductase [bacterium]
MKKILITGASGFIGSFLVEEALTRNYEVYAGIRKTSSKVYLRDARINFLELDFADRDALHKTISTAPHFDFVIHNAGITKALKKEDFFVSNYSYTKLLVEALLFHNNVPSKFIYMSSLAAYGPGNPVTQEAVKESDTPHPVTYYGSSKLQSETYLSLLPNFPYLIIRPTAVYGPRDKDFLSLFKLIRNHLELIVGSNKQQLSFVYVKDLVSAVFLAMESQALNRAFFVSDGKSYKSDVFGNLLKEQLGKNTLRIKVPTLLAFLIASLSESTQYLSGIPALLNRDKLNELKAVNWNCDTTPLVREFGFKPAYDLSSGIQETIFWYREAGWLKK